MYGFEIMGPVKKFSSAHFSQYDSSIISMLVLQVTLDLSLSCYASQLYLAGIITMRQLPEKELSPKLQTLQSPHGRGIFADIAFMRSFQE